MYSDFFLRSENVILQLDEVARTARENACKKAIYFIYEESDHQGFVRSDMDDIDKAALIARMEFTAEHGCKLLHKIMEDGTTLWFGNEDFASILKESLYDITSPGWCGGLASMPLPRATAVCQLTEPTPYLVASQITWVSHSRVS